MIIIGIVIICVIFLGDLWIKNKIEHALTLNETKEWLGGKLLIRKYHNRGAALNLGERHRGAVAALSVFFCILVGIWFVLSFTRSGNGLLRMGLSLLLGGAFSNAYDRLKRRYVVDYFSLGVRWKRLRSIVFNLSDFCILIGAMLAAIGYERL